MIQIDLAVVILAQKGGNDLLRDALQPFGKEGIPLVIWKIRQLKKVLSADNVYVSTYSEAIKKLVILEGVHVHNRAKDFEEENLGDIVDVIEDMASGIDQWHLA